MILMKQDKREDSPIKESRSFAFENRRGRKMSEEEFLELVCSESLHGHLPRKWYCTSRLWHIGNPCVFCGYKEPEEKP